ncbi:microfibril-associated protein [Colletotrichum tofieldiae]|uniref:Microfibril-associated protein n=1 Tax=Colletotrichum tofieldiae TaxID=708197 RepID=A0A161V3L5_9PEZI|nr:microfibril-associated protein [Colletotrichum tofieldiae]GKT84604.1 microfibril-associated protein [Colletotrichum tofieldiae]
MPPKRMTANPIKPARYRAGKPVAPEASSSDSDGSDDETNEAVTKARAIPPPPKASSAAKIASNLSKVNLDERRRDAQEKESLRIAREKAERLAAEEGFVTEEEDEEEEGDGDEEEESSSEEETSSEEEAPRRLMIRPKFIPKNQRNAAKDQSAAPKDEDARFAEEEARRKAAADALVEEQIKKDLAARAAGKKHWDDDEASGSDVDTTDDLDPEAELAAWKLRELKRVKRERDRIAEQEAEYAERERRQNLTQEEREAEDAEKLARQQEEKDAKGKMSYLQKYYHKGAFYSDEAKAYGLDKRDIMGMRIADDVKDRSALPEYLQKRDMTKLGRKGATKYKDLKSEDTGRWGEFDDRRGGDRRGFNRYDVDERFRPDNDREVNGANAIPLGDRKAPDGPKGDRSDRYRDDNRRDRDDKHRSRDDFRRRDRSKSRSPRHNSRDEYRDRRKRSPSPDRDRYDSDKRRRVDP